MSGRSAPILCVGALTMDTIFRLDRLPDGPGKFIPTEAVEVAEGMAAAQAASIVRLGGRAALWASRGDDAVGERLVAGIAAEGVDTSPVRIVPGRRSGFSSIFMDARGERMIVPRYDPELMAPPPALPAVDFRQFGAVMADVRWPGAAALALSAAREAGIPAILDADVAAAEVLERLAALVTHIVASEGGGRLLTGESDASRATAVLAARFGTFAAVTSGEHGCHWTDGETIRHTPAPRVEAIDTLAAGDVFHAGFAVGVVEGRPMAETIRFASLAAAIKCTRFGGRLGCPGRTEVDSAIIAESVG